MVDGLLDAVDGLRVIASRDLDSSVRRGGTRPFRIQRSLDVIAVLIDARIEARRAARGRRRVNGHQDA